MEDFLLDFLADLRELKKLIADFNKAVDTILGAR